MTCWDVHWKKHTWLLTSREQVAIDVVTRYCVAWLRTEPTRKDEGAVRRERARRRTQGFFIFALFTALPMLKWSNLLVTVVNERSCC